MSESLFTTRESPKSINLRLLVFFSKSMIFSGLRSRWTMFFLCICFKPSKICFKSSIVSLSLRPSLSDIKSNSSPPRTLNKRQKNDLKCHKFKHRAQCTYSSKIKITSCPLSYTLYNLTIFSWFNFCKMLTSRWMSSIITPRRLPVTRFLRINFAAYSLAVLFSIHLRTVANWPLKKRRRRGVESLFN